MRHTKLGLTGDDEGDNIKGAVSGSLECQARQHDDETSMSKIK